MRRFLTHIAGEPAYLSTRPGQPGQLYSGLAVGGQTIAQLRNRVMRCRAIGFDYRIGREVYVMIGTNDVRRKTSFHVLKKELQRLLEVLKTQGVRRINLCTVPRPRQPSSVRWRYSMNGSARTETVES
ncbi:uncharacterized protein LOC116166515 [Photinus pyralis]|nr:uncharacterized protein LOC116166515 [Photinus pyralis]